MQYALGTLDEYDLIKMVNDSNTLIEVLKILSKDKHPNVRYHIAANPNTPMDVLMKLSTDKDRHIRCQVAYRKDIPIEMLIELSKDKNSWVKLRIANNPNTPETIARNCRKMIENKSRTQDSADASQ